MKRYALAGGPSSGKTTLIEALRDAGFSVADEVARAVIQDGFTGDSPKEVIARQKEILTRQLKLEASVAEDTFFDRGSVDGLAYCQHHLGRIPKELMKYVNK